MRIFITATILCLGFFLSSNLTADVYRACGNSLNGLYGAEEAALSRSLNARGRDGRDNEHSYRAQISYSVRELNIADHPVGDYVFEWKACVEVSDIPEDTDISRKPNCSQLDLARAGEGLLRSSPKLFPHGQIVPIASSIYLAPEWFDGYRGSFWYMCAEVEEAKNEAQDKSICGQSMGSSSGALNILQKHFSRWYLGKHNFLIEAEKPVHIKYSTARSVLTPGTLDWEVCMVPPEAIPSRL